MNITGCDFYFHFFFYLGVGKVTLSTAGNIFSIMRWLRMVRLAKVTRSWSRFSITSSLDGGGLLNSLRCV